MTITLKNNTGYDIKDCSIFLLQGKKKLSWFEDGDVITISFQPRDAPPKLVGYLDDDDETLVEGTARPLASRVDGIVVKWVFNKVHECEDDD